MAPFVAYRPESLGGWRAHGRDPCRRRTSAVASARHFPRRLDPTFGDAVPTLVRLLVSVVVALAVLSPPAGAAARTVEYHPPVDAPITDPFRAPVHRYAAGNRGIDYATDEGQAVHAAADGVVSFAGRVGKDLHVVIAHADGVRTSYSFLASVTVRRAQRVERGDAVGTAKRSLHFGARIGDAYVDPRDLFGGGGRARVHLVDDDDQPRRTTPSEDRDLLAAYLRRLGPAPTVSDIARWEGDQERCSEPAEAAGAAHGQPQRRIALLVGGLGSATGEAAILDVDTAALGYAPGDVHQFSYRGDGATYGAADTLQDIAASAEALARTLRNLTGAPVDLFAHSMGGLVTRAALASDPAAFAHVETIVTIATPHLGNTLAAAGAALRTPLHLGHLDTSATALAQLASGSSFIGERAGEAAPPAHITLRSIAASSDPMVPAASARWAAAANVVVDLDGPPTPLDHSRVTSDPATTRELALAVAGLPPGCVAYADWRARHHEAAAITRAQAAAARAVAWLDERVPAGRWVVARR